MTHLGFAMKDALRDAKRPEDVDKLMRYSERFTAASEKTRRQWAKLAAARKARLEEVQGLLDAKPKGGKHAS